MTIEEQKEILSKKLKMVRLCSSEEHKALIRNFTQAEHGTAIEDYLKEKAWQADNDRETKVFLVKDVEKNEIAYFFAVNCGILYSDLDGIKLHDYEKELYQNYLNALIDARNTRLSRGQRDRALGELAKATEAFNSSGIEPDRISQLISSAEEKALNKEEKKDFFEDTDEEKQTTRVKETFPAIDIKFLCRNSSYDPGIKTEFRLGVYVFWEIIVPHLLRVANCVGCKYIYLFAADRSSLEEDYMPMPFFDENYDPYEDEDIAEKKKVLKLVEYYQNELKFRFVERYKILKPDYERLCYTLIQEVDSLQANRQLVWQSHTPENYSDYSE